jgi:hypothetical protein
VRRAGLVAFLILTLAPPAPTHAADPGRWVTAGFSRIPLDYYQGVSSDPAGNLYFDGRFIGLYKTTLRLKETVRVPNAIPGAVAAAEGYNHIGDLTWDGAEGGRLLLPLECFSPGLPGGPNTCGTGSIAAADPVSLAWRYYVKLDPADIKKVMWAEVSPDGALIWTSAGRDLLAYRSSDVSGSNAAPAARPIRPARRLPGAVPPSGVTGATFYRDRLLVAGQGTGLFQVWSVDVTTGKSRLEIERQFSGESEGLDVVRVLGGVLHWQVQPFSSMPTFGIGRGALLHFVPAGRARLRLRVSPRSVRAALRTRFVFRASFRFGGRRHAVAGARIRFAGRTARTDGNGRAVLRLALRPGRRVASAHTRGLRRGRVLIRVRR